MKKSLTPLAAKIEAWRRGIIHTWYLRQDQIPVFNFLRAHRFPVAECGRRYGKTTIDLVDVCERLNRNEMWVWRWCEPWKTQAREIVMPEIDKIQHEIPTKMKFKFYRTDSFYESPLTGSRLYLRGVNDDRGESARGSFANGITADEKGSWRDPTYIVDEVLMPQLLTTRGDLHTLSTPPKDLGHAWYMVDKKRAIEDNRFIQRLSTDNTSLTQQDLDEMVKAVGGRDTAAWRREYLCEPVADIESLVIPEYDGKIHDYTDASRKRAIYFDAYVGGDLGFHDHTALLFGHYDFLSTELVIEDELFVAGKNSKEITDAAKLTEMRLWGVDGPHGRRLPQECPYLRVCDNELQQLHDMATLCGYQMLPTRKDDKEAAINALRLRFRSGKIRIHERCRNLRFQLQVGMWNEKRTNYERGDSTGHLDAIDALIYLNRNINASRNPYPQNVGVSNQTHFVPEEMAKESERDAEALRRALFPLQIPRW